MADHSHSSGARSRGNSGAKAPAAAASSSSAATAIAAHAAPADPVSPSSPSSQTHSQPRAIHMRFHDRDNSGGGGGGAGGGGGVAVASARVSFSSSSSSPSAAHRARLANNNSAAAAAASSHPHAHHGASSFSLSTGTRTRSSTEDSPIVRPRFHSESEEGGSALQTLQMLSNVTRAGSHRHAAVMATNPAADVPASSFSASASASPYTAAHDDQRNSLSSTQMPSWSIDSPTAAAAESKEQSETTFMLGAAASSSAASSSSPALQPSSPKRLPLHFHSKLPSSAHNPLVMLDKFRSASGAAVVGLDEAEIKLEEASAAGAAATAADGQPLSPRSLAELPDSVTAHLPIPIGPPTAHFTQSSWSWKHIDYVETHLPLLSDFFSALETHSEAFVERLNRPPPAAVVPPVMMGARRASLDRLPPLPPVRSSPAKDSSASMMVAGSPPRQSASASLLLASLTPLQAAASSSSSSSESGSGSGSPRRALPSYPPHFVPHRIASLQMHARKELLRKTKVVTSPENGPGLIERNPSEQLLAFLVAASGTMPASATSSGAHTARGHSSAYYSSNAAAASAAASLLSASSASASGLPPPSGLNVIPHLTSLDFRMGISGELLAESLKRNHSLTHLCVSHNVIAVKGCNALCRNLQSHPQLRTLDLSHNILYPESAPALRDLLLYNRTLSSLDLAINKLGAAGVSTVMEALGASKPNMRAIKTAVERALAPVSVANLSSSPPNSARLGSSPLSFNSASSASSSASVNNISQQANGAPTLSASPPASAGLAGSPNASPSPPSAGASGSGAASSSASSGAAGSLSSSLSLMPAFSINQTLTSLNLANNKLGSEIDSVASALCCSNSALRELNLSLNDIGDTGANFLALALRNPNCCMLRALNLGDNLIGPMGVKVLCQALEQNHTLQRLDLSWNTLGQSGLGEGPRAVGRLLASNTTLRELVLQSNCISDGGLKAICAGWMECLERSAAAAAAGAAAASVSAAGALHVHGSSLQLLDLSVNPLGDFGLRELATILAHARCPLRTLMLNRCQLSEDGCAALISVMPVNQRLTRLSMQGNASLKASTIASLIDTYARSPHLLELDVDDSPHITRDDALAALYRRARTNTFASLVTKGSGMPLELTTIVAEYILDLKHKAQSNHDTAA